ncbi:MAG: YihA family ribosome biogenesis GTP-binding protein [Desulfobulbaceae bacterium]|nr:YihA family ribosome biogenesis GTP-binding protein [Desulfobulbaceae bacterium]
MIPLQQARFLLAAHTLQQLPPPLVPEIAFAGRSNVGKSSLINRLLGRKGLVKTSSKPGKTQSLNFFSLADTLYFVDLPGYGYAQVSKEQRRFWGDLVAGYVEQRQGLLCVVVIIDLRHELKQQDLELVSWLKHIGRPYLLIYTKADKLSRNQQEKNAALLDAGLKANRNERVLFSSQTGQGREELLAKIGQMLAAVPGTSFIETVGEQPAQEEKPSAPASE